MAAPEPRKGALTVAVTSIGRAPPSLPPRPAAAAKTASKPQRGTRRTLTKWRRRGGRRVEDMDDEDDDEGDVGPGTEEPRDG